MGLYQSLTFSSQRITSDYVTPRIHTENNDARWNTITDEVRKGNEKQGRKNLALDREPFEEEVSAALNGAVVSVEVHLHRAW